MGCCNSKEEKITSTALVQLIRAGRDQDLLRHLQSWTAQDLQGVKGLLHEACSALQPGCVGVLLQVGVPFDGRDERLRTPLHVLILEAAKQDGHTDRAAKALGIMRQILKHASVQGRLPQLDVPDQNYTPLLLSVVSQQDLLTSELLLANFDLAAVTVQEKNNVLHLSVSNVHQLMSLLEAAADRRMNAVLVNEPNVDGNTPLHLALLAMRELPLFPTSGGLQMANANPLSVAASMLIERGCFIDMPNRAGQSAVSLAVDCAMRVLQAGADTGACTEVLLTIAKGRVAASPDIFNQPGDMGRAAVHVAAALGHVPLLNSLEARGARMDVQDADGRLPAVLAAQAGNKAALLRMLGHLRADGLCRERSGQSAATAVLLNPAFSPEDVHAILRTMIRGWGEQQRLSAQPVLCLACQRGNVDTVKLLVLEGEVDACGRQGCMPLMATVEAHCKTPSQQLVKIVEFLMEQGADPVAEDNTRATALGTALEGGHLDMAMVMLRAQSVHVDHVAPNGHTALYLAIRGGYTAMARELVTYNACTGPRPGLTYIPLHVAVEKMNVAIVELLLKTEQGRQAVAVKDATNKSVLDYLWASWAAVAPRGPPPPPGKPAVPPTPEVVALLEIAKLLLSHPNCDVNALDTMGMRPMHWAVQLDQPKLVETLASRGTDINPNLVDAEGVTPLFRAVQRGSQELVQTMLEVLGDLLDFGAKSKVAGVEQGGTVLQAAVSAANVKLVKALINRRGVQVDRRSFDLCLRLVATRPTQCSEIMALLLSNGGISLAGAGNGKASGPPSTLSTAASVPTPANGIAWEPDAPPLPPLHQVVCYNNAELVKLLVVRADADVDEKDANGMTPLHHAVERKSYEAAVKLVTLGARVSELSHGPTGTTPLIAAVAALDLQMVKELLKSESGLDVNKTDARGHSALTVALRALLSPPRASDAQRQRVVDAATEIANRLLRVGADCNQPLLTARQWAARDLDGCDSVASTGSAPTGEPAGPVLSFAVTEYGMEDDLFTPLLAAISMASGTVVQMLLQEKTVEVNGFEGGPAAIHIALRCALAATNAAARSISLREEAPPAPPSERSAWELLPFNSIQRRGHVPVATGPLAEARTTAMRILRMLAQEDRVNLLQPNPWLGPGGHKGPSVLMQLVVIGGIEAVELVRDLLAVGRELQVNNPDPMTGETVLHVAAAKGDCAMLEVLIQARNVDLNALDKKGRSPLASAVANDQVYAIRCLLSHGRSNMHAKAPLDPCICGAIDPASSPMALAIAQPSAHSLEALLYGTRHADRHFGGHSRAESQTDQGSLAGDAYDVRVMIQSENGSAAPSYDVATLLSASVDATGRPPILAAMIACKLEHVRMLVEFGARLDVQGDAPALTASVMQNVVATPQASGLLPTPGGRGPPPATPLPSVTATPAGGEARKVLSTPFSLLCQYVRNLDNGRDKTRLDQAKSLAVMMAEHPTLDIKDGTELQWAVLSRNVAAVEALAIRAQRAGLINARASVFRGHRCTALELAVQQDLVPIARALLMRGASSDTAMLAQAAKAKKEMYTLLKHPPQVLPVEPAPHEQTLVMPGPQSRGLPPDPPVPDKKPDPPVTGPGIGTIPRDPTPEELHQAFRTNLCLAVGAAGGPGGTFFAPGPVADALESECAIAESLLAVDMATVVLHRACLEQMCDNIRKQLPTLRALQDECQRRKDTGRGTVPKDVLPCVEKLGELYIQVHRKAVDWCTTEKASLVKRMLQANEYQEIQQMKLALYSHMLALALAVDAAQMLPESVAELFAADQKQLEETVKTVIQTDMQSEMRDLHATVLILGEEAQNQAVKMFRSFGLTYHRTIQKWLRETVFPTLVIKHSSLAVVKKVGSGATATVYLVKHNDQLKAFKRFDAMLPGAQEAVSCEGFVLSTLDHPNVLRLHGIVIERDQCGLVVDYHENGSLHQLIQACAAGTQPMSLVKRVALAVQIAKGMAYLHGHSLGSIVHGDLKPSNVLISRDRRAIIDFGLASGMADGWTATQAPTTNAANQHAGTYDALAVYYQAPEVLQQLLAGKKREASSDVFAFGVLLLELMTLKPVRTGFARDPADYQYKLERGDRPTIPEQLPGPLQFCMGLCWAQNTDHRPSFATVVDLLTHVYTDLVDDVQ